MVPDQTFEMTRAAFYAAAKRPDSFTLVRVLPVGRDLDAAGDVISVGWLTWSVVMSME